MKTGRRTRRSFLVGGAGLAGASLAAASPARSGVGGSPAAPVNRLPRWRGFNLQYLYRLRRGLTPPVEDHFRWIAGWGFDFVRMPMTYRAWLKRRPGPGERLQEEDVFQSKKEHYQFYHELSHLWNPTPLDPIPCRFESEGLATFMGYFLAERLDNKKDGLAKGFTDVKGRYRERCRENPEYPDIPMIDFGAKGITDLSYLKGMLFFNILYELVGEDAFFDILKGFYRKYEGRGATTANFVDYLNNYSKKDLSRFTGEWVYGTQSTRDLMNNLSLVQIVNKYNRP